MDNFERQFNKNANSKITETVFNPDSKKEEDKSIESLENNIKEIKDKYQKYINNNKSYFQVFAKDTSINFVMSNGFKINFETGEVNLDTKWFSDHDFTENQITWAVYHELCHFRDLAEDPDGIMKNFEYIRQQAKNTGSILEKKYKDKFSTTDPKFVEKIKKQKPIDTNDVSKGTMNQCEISAYKYYHTFFNIFDDIYVNSLVAKKSPRYLPDSKGGEEISRLYREKLFKENDYTNFPRHLQFLYKLLREEMVPKEKVIVSDEVEKILENKIAFQGKNFTPKQLVDNFLKPISRKDTKASTRYFILKNTLEPIFEQLLLKDIEELDIQKPPKEDKSNEKPGDSENDQESSDSDEFESESEGDEESKEDKNNEGKESSEKDNNKSKESNEKYDSADPFNKYYKESLPDPLDNKTIPKWIEKEKQKQEDEKKQKQEEAKSQEQKEKEMQEAVNKKWCEENGISNEELKEYIKIKEEVSPYLEDLSVLWRKIIYGKGREIQRGTEGYFKTGTELDISEVISRFPEIEKGDIDSVRVMKKEVEKEIPVNRPELIRVRIVGDMSGSMNDFEKINTLKQCFVLLLSSLKEFDSYLNISRSETKTKMKVDTEAWVFGDYEEKIKSFESESGGSSDDTANIVKVLNKLNNPDGGSTMDNKALDAIYESQRLEDKMRMSQKKIMDIVFEITDGGSSYPLDTRKSVDNLSQEGFITRAFQIGDTDVDERQTFNFVWNDNRENGLGEIVGSKIKNLIPAVVKALKKYLENVQI